MSHVTTLNDADQYTKERMEADKQYIVREVIVEKKVYLEIPKEVIKKVEVIKEVIKEVIMDGALAVCDPKDFASHF
jgi:hypothetical protein